MSEHGVGTAGELVTALRAELERLRSQGKGADTVLLSNARARGMVLIRQLAAAREREGCGVFNDDGWDPSRSGNQHPLAWCSEQGLEELADLVNYGGRFPARCRLKPDRFMDRMVTLGRQVDLAVAQLVVLLVELHELSDDCTVTS